MIDLGALASAILGPTLAARGMTIDAYAEEAVTFRDERRVVSLSYNPEDPRPWLSVVLGLRVEGGELLLALWRLYPEVPSLAQVTNGAFDSSATLRVRLVVVRDEWLESYVWPAFAQPERFRAAALVQRDEVDRRYEGDVRRQRLAQARSAYDHGDLARAVEQFTLAGVDDLSAADRRRYVMAQRGVGPRT